MKTGTQTQKKNELVVRVKLKVTVDLAAYREAYGHEDLDMIRRSVRHGAADGLEATISTGIRDIEVI